MVASALVVHGSGGGGDGGRRVAGIKNDWSMNSCVESLEGACSAENCSPARRGLTCLSHGDAAVEGVGFPQHSYLERSMTCVEHCWRAKEGTLVKF